MLSTRDALYSEAVPCADDDVGLRADGFTGGTCVDAVKYCQHNEHGPIARKNCPKTCGKCTAAPSSAPAKPEALPSWATCADQDNATVTAIARVFGLKTDQYSCAKALLDGVCGMAVAAQVCPVTCNLCPRPAGDLCVDDDTGLQKNSGRPDATCAKGLVFCTDTTHGPMVRGYCPKTCGVCKAVAPSAARTRVPAGQVDTCCKGMTKECLACQKGISVEEFCKSSANEEYCGRPSVCMTDKDCDAGKECYMGGTDHAACVTKGNKGVARPTHAPVPMVFLPLWMPFSLSQFNAVKEPLKGKLAAVAGISSSRMHFGDPKSATAMLPAEESSTSALEQLQVSTGIEVPVEIEDGPGKSAQQAADLLKKTNLTELVKLVGAGAFFENILNPKSLTVQPPTNVDPSPATSPPGSSSSKMWILPLALFGGALFAVMGYLAVKHNRSQRVPNARRASSLLFQEVQDRRQSRSSAEGLLQRVDSCRTSAGPQQSIKQEHLI